MTCDHTDYDRDICGGCVVCLKAEISRLTVERDRYADGIRKLVEDESVQCGSCKRAVPVPDAEFCPYCAVAFGGRFHLRTGGE